MASTSDPALWLWSFKGAVFPLDLHAKPSHGSYVDFKVKSLVELCAEYIVRDSTMTEQALAIVPRQLCLPLLQEALRKNRDMSIRSIIKTWPMQTLLLHKMVPNHFASTLPLINSAFLGELVRQSLRYTTTLTHTFLEALKSGSPTKLRYLDLTGFPTAEVIVYFLATHCMLAHNEVRHETVMQMFCQALQQAGKSIQAADGVEPLEHSLPQDCTVVVRLDAFVTSESTHEELCKALKVSSFQNRKLRILIRRLGISCLGHSRISLLLQQVDPKQLTGLQLQYNGLTADDLSRIAPVLKSLVCLESLDLSTNSIFFYRHPESVVVFAEVLQAMPHLRRLDLSNNRLKMQLRRILEAVEQPLTFLGLAGCGLTVSDLTYLSQSHHCSALQELELSENSLKSSERQIIKLLDATKLTLLTLELEECDMDDQIVQSIMLALSSLQCLIYLNLATNRISGLCLISLVSSLSKIVTLQAFKSSYPVDCYDLENDIMEEQKKAELVNKLNTVCNHSNVPTLRSKAVQLVLMELDKIPDDTE